MVLTSQQVQDTIDLAIDQMQQYSQGQVDIWRQLPYWARLANGRTGYSDKLGSMYGNGLLPLDSSVPSGGRYRHYLDLETGVITRGGDQPIGAEGRVLAYQAYIDPSILDIELSELNAQNWLTRLQSGAQVDFSPIYKEGDRKRWADSVQSDLQRYDLSPDKPYTRFYRVRWGTGVET